MSPKARRRKRGRGRKRRKKGGRLRSLARRWWVIAALAVGLGAVGTLTWTLAGVPVPELPPPPESSRILAADGSELGLLHGEQNRQIVPLDEVAPHLREAVVATEDRSFYDHPGISARGIIRAGWENVRGRTVSQGGSTITQQYVRNAFEEVGRERTIWRKIREAVVAVKLERRISKDKILELYLNTVYFGRGAYGAEAAARTYFKKPANKLDLSESAYLAGVIRSPENYKSQEGALSIRDQVLDDMVRDDRLEKASADEAKQADITFRFADGEDEPVRAAYYFEFVRRLLKRPVEEGGFALTDKDLLAGGLEIHTTLDSRLQLAAEQAVLDQFDRTDDPEAALVAMDVEGRIVAMVGGREFTNLERARGFNFAYQKGGGIGEGGRQAGSIFKPFALAAFVEKGNSVNSIFNAPGSLTISSRQCRDQTGKSWDVSNFDKADKGAISLVDGIAGSVNTVFAQVVDLVGAKEVKEVAQKSGGFTGLQAVCSITLGTSGVTPLEMARSYATFAARGHRPEVLAVTKVVAPDGRVVAERSPKSTEVLSERVADTVNFSLQAVMTRGTGRRLSIGRTSAGKTGTTENNVDAWFVGYTPQLVTAVWVGFPLKDGKIQEMKSVRGITVVGGSFPGRIWRSFMIQAHEGLEKKNFNKPQITGSVISPSPSPCPEGTSPLPFTICVSPSPEPPPPSPEPTASPSPTPSASPSPAPTPSPSP